MGRLVGCIAYVFSLWVLSFILHGCSEADELVADSNTNRLSIYTSSEYVLDENRGRIIPIEVYEISEKEKSELVIINAGYGCSNTEYSYLSKELAKEGYLVICIQHELATDPPLPSGENIYEIRMSNWQEGIKSVHSVKQWVSQNYPGLEGESFHLIGHSNGGDISALFTSLFPEEVLSCMTLDHRRVPIPLNMNVPFLSIRSDEYQADPGVIPIKMDQEKYKIEIVTLSGVGHNFLRDNATQKTKKKIITELRSFYKLD